MAKTAVAGLDMELVEIAMAYQRSRVLCAAARLGVSPRARKTVTADPGHRSLLSLQRRERTQRRRRARTVGQRAQRPLDARKPG